jgi:choline kinase
VVSFPDEGISPLLIGKNKELDQKDYLDLDKPGKQFTANSRGKRLAGRPSMEHLNSHRLQSIESNPSLTSVLSDSSADAHQHPHVHERLVKHVTEWLKSERSRRSARRAKRKGAKNAAENTASASDVTTEATEQHSSARGRSGSDSSQGSVALDQLASILEKTLSIKPAEAKRRINHARRLSTGLKRHSAISMDSDYFDSVDQLVPSCDVVLDNSKTMAYSVDGPDGEVETEDSEKRSRKEKEAWSTFKFEILRLAHTLKLKGWRRVVMEQSDEIEVQRLSGALTNAVYVVAPPKNLASQQERSDGVPTPKNPPP